MGVFGPPLIPFLGLIQSRVRRPGPDSESAQPDSESEVRVSGSSGDPSQLVRVTDTSQPAAEVDPVLVRAMPFSRECFSHFLAVRCNSLPQRGRATGPLPGAGYRAGAGGTPPYPEVGRLAVWVRLPRSAARSASKSTRAAGSSRSRQW